MLVNELCCPPLIFTIAFTANELGILNSIDDSFLAHRYVNVSLIIQFFTSIYP